MANVWLSLLVFVTFTAFVCDGSHAPVIRNALDEPIELSVTYSSGQTFAGKYPPGAQIYAPAEGLDVEKVEVGVGGVTLFRLSKEELAGLRAEFGPHDRILWNVHRGGMYPTPLGR